MKEHSKGARDHHGEHKHPGHMDHHKPHMKEKHHGDSSNPLSFSHVGMAQAHGIKK